MYNTPSRPGEQVSLEHQAYMLLTESERQTMAYYVQEYQDGHIGVEPLAMALFELFNTDAKLSMLSEVRGLLAPQDQELYDRLVLHHDRQGNRVWHGSLNKEDHTIPLMLYAGPPVPPTAGNQTSGDSPSLFRASPMAQSRKSRERELSLKPSARLVHPNSNLLFTDPAPLCCHHKPPNSYQFSPSSARYNCTGASCLTAPSQRSFPPFDTRHLSHCHCAHQPHDHAALHNKTSSGHHTCPGFLHYQDSSRFVKRDVKLSSRSSSYEKSSVLSKSASSSKAASPLPSPHLSPRPSPCSSPCPSVITMAAQSNSLSQTGSPAFPHKVTVTDMDRLQSADSRSPQRGTTLFQLSDSGQTLSEDSGVDIPEAGGGLSRDVSSRPSKKQQTHPEQQGAHAPPSGATRQMDPVPAATLVRMMKMTKTLGIAIEGGANTQQPLPRIVTVQKGGSAYNCGQLKVGQVIVEVNGISLRGRKHKDVTRIIAEAFKTSEKDYVDFIVFEPEL